MSYGLDLLKYEDGCSKSGDGFHKYIEEHRYDVRVEGWYDVEGPPPVEPTGDRRIRCTACDHLYDNVSILDYNGPSANPDGGF